MSMTFPGPDPALVLPRMMEAFMVTPPRVDGISTEVSSILGKTHEPLLECTSWMRPDLTKRVARRLIAALVRATSPSMTLNSSPAALDLNHERTGR